MLRLFEGRPDPNQDVLAPWVEPETTTSAPDVIQPVAPQNVVRDPEPPSLGYVGLEPEGGLEGDAEVEPGIGLEGDTEVEHGGGLERNAPLEHAAVRGPNPSRRSASGAKQIIAFCGAVGSVGKTSVAINVAYELAEAGYRVALIDLDVRAPSLMAALNQDPITPGLSGVVRLVGQGRFAADDLNRFLMVLNFDGVRVSVLPGLSFAMPESRDSALLAKAANEVVLAAEVDYVVLDLPDIAVEPEVVGVGLNLADFSFAICNADPIGVQRYLWLKGQLKKLNLKHEPQLVCNRVRESVLGPNPKSQLAQTFERLAQTDVVAFVPEDSSAFDIAMREGLPLQLAKKSSPARHAISMFVRQGILGQRSRLDWRIARNG